MINGSANNLPAAPTTYAQYMSAIISKLLALVNLGWSLELSGPAFYDESTLSTREPPMTLLEPQSQTLPTGRSTKAPPPAVEQQQYCFPLKVGDKERIYDGLVGYWKPQAGSHDKFDLDHLYTYWPTEASTTSDNPTCIIDHAAYLQVSAFHTYPNAYTAPTDLNSEITVKSPEQMAVERNSHWNVISALVDPFTMVHAYSGILPVASVTLPPWTIERALSMMTAFFRMGPILVTNEPPPWNSAQQLSEDADASVSVAGSSVAVPAASVGTWTWLQPYDVADGALEEYMPLKVGKVDGIPRFEDGVCTFVEGYLRLAKPLASS